MHWRGTIFSLSPTYFDVSDAADAAKKLLALDSVATALARSVSIVSKAALRISSPSSTVFMQRSRNWPVRPAVTESASVIQTISDENTDGLCSTTPMSWRISLHMASERQWPGWSGTLGKSPLGGE